MSDAYTTREDVIAQIDAFTKLYPDMEYSFAHIVLSDYNLSNGNIAFCLQPSEIMSYLDLHKTSAKLPDLIIQSGETVKFLRWLLTINETVRLQGDDESQ